MSQDDDFEIIRAEDFVSMETFIEFENVVTKTKTKKDDLGTTKIVEFNEDGLTLEAPPKLCNKGHQLMLHLWTKNAPEKKDIDFKATCKVVAVEKLPEGTDRIQLDLIQFNEVVWKKYLQLFSKRQDEILEFFKAVKGY